VTTRGRPKRPPEAASPITRFLRPVSEVPMSPKEAVSPPQHKIQLLDAARLINFFRTYVILYTELRLLSYLRIYLPSLRIIVYRLCFKNNGCMLHFCLICRGNQILKEATQTSVAAFFGVRRSSRKPGKTLAEEKQRQMQEAVDSLSEDHLTVKSFEGKGRGVVATRCVLYCPCFMIGN
jgi:hypothetical protein